MELSYKTNSYTFISNFPWKIQIHDNSTFSTFKKRDNFRKGWGDSVATYKLIKTPINKFQFSVEFAFSLKVLWLIIQSSALTDGNI